MKSENEKIDFTIKSYEERRDEILDFINKKDELNRKHRLGSGIIISKGKELELISYQLHALQIAKKNHK